MRTIQLTLAGKENGGKGEIELKLELDGFVVGEPELYGPTLLTERERAILRSLLHVHAIGHAGWEALDDVGLMPTATDEERHFAGPSPGVLADPRVAACPQS